MIGLVVTASGGDPVLARIAEAGKEARSFRYVMHQTIETGFSASVAALDMRGAVDIDGRRSKMVMNAKGGALDLRCTVVAVGDVLYSAVHPTKRSTVGASWLRSDLEALSKFSGFEFRPETMYAEPDRFITDLRVEGPAEVKGAKTTKYRGTMDLGSVFKTLGAVSPAPTEFDVDLSVFLYIDDRGLIRRMTMEFSPKVEPKITSKATIDFFDYGKPLEIAEPAADTVKDGTAEELQFACLPSAPLPAY